MLSNRIRTTGPLALAAFLAGAMAGSFAQVAEQLGQQEHEEFLAKHYPFVEQSAEPPGRSVPSSQLPGTMTWSGLASWRTRHGPVVVWFRRGTPFRAEGARLPDGSRGDVGYFLDHGWRRPAGDGRRWVHGTVDIRPDDVLFIDGSQPVYAPPPRTRVPNLEADLARDAEFLAAIQDDRFAKAVYSVFGNRTFYKGEDQRRWLCGERQAARLVRDLRALGESYQDWFPHDGLDGVYPDDRPDREAHLRRQIERFSEPYTFERVLQAPVAEHLRSEYLKRVEAERAEYERRLPEMNEERLKSLERTKQALAKLESNADVYKALHDHLARIGWRTENEQDRERARQRWLRRAVAVLQDIRGLEKRRAGSPGEWVEAVRRRQDRVVAFSREEVGRMSEDEREVQTGRMQARLTNLGITGRISKEEYDGLLKRLKRD